MDLNELRNRINEVDGEIVGLMKKRMDICKDIAEYKKENDLPVLDSKREREKLGEIAEAAGPEMDSYMRVLYSLIFEMSRSYQNTVINRKNPLADEINDAIENTERLFPESCTVACQGVEGANSVTACERIFKSPNIMHMKTFESVFDAVDRGFCRYGIIPLENSTAGSVKKVYDLMIQKRFYIVKSVRVKIEHNLLAKEGTALEDIREIYSHEQAINQCSEFLSSLKDVKVIPCENTAVAAQMVASSGRKDVAAISSYICAELYNLSCVRHNIEDNSNNHTRFICISKKLEIYPGADRTSLMMVLKHRPGALYKVLAKLFALGINLIKLESRPIPDRDFEFMFYFDLETSVYSDEFVKMICELDNVSDEFRYLGSYLETV